MVLFEMATQLIDFDARDFKSLFVVDRSTCIRQYRVLQVLNTTKIDGFLNTTS